MHQTKTILLASLLLFPLPSLAQTEVPNAFSDGTPALAAEVNENFTAVADGVNAQDVRIQTVEEESSSQDLRIQTVENAIAGPQEMVFLGYAESDAEISYNDLYGWNQVCKNAYSNPTARVVTITAWTIFVNEGQQPLPSALAAIWGSDDAYVPSSGYYYIQTTGRLLRTALTVVSGGLFACMAPAG